jgi:hypothetical protein
MGEAIDCRDLREGSANFSEEVNEEASVIWTKPDDLAYDVDKPLVGLGTAHPGGSILTIRNLGVSDAAEPRPWVSVLALAECPIHKRDRRH